MRNAPECADLVGKPFAYGGRGPDKFDCYGLLMEMNRRAGIVIPDYFSPDDLQRIALIIAGEKRLWEPLKGPIAGAAVALRVGRYICHVGYMLDRSNMIHTWEMSGGVVIEPLTGWERRIEGFYRFATQ
jgi:cell wall-associated NlpC family hydrolase